jgi:AraC family transcriptional regulator
MEPRIQQVDSFMLVGNKTLMSFSTNQTSRLWQQFMPRRKEIANSIGLELYSVERYLDPTFFAHFDPTKEFEKWAAVRVSAFDAIPAGMETLLIPSGAYAVFHYKGKPSEAQATYQYIYGQWIPSSVYVLDSRPHFAVMGELYKGEHPDSEEELWIPIAKKPEVNI